MGAIGLYAEFAGGSGTKEDPWLIETAEQLNNVRNYLGEANDDKYFKQIADIDLGTAPWNQEYGWEPIGTEENAFMGYYDGDNYKINKLRINRYDSNYIGLFGYCTGAYLTNIAIESMYISGTDYVGGLAGYFEGIEKAGTRDRFGKIVGCSVSGEVIGNSRVGGLLGLACYAKIERSSAPYIQIRIYQKTPYEEGALTGGFIGHVKYDVKISDCFIKGYELDASDKESTGEFVGRAGRTVIINNCYVYMYRASKPFVGNSIVPLSEMVQNCYVTSNYYRYFESELDRKMWEMTCPYSENTFIDWDFENIWAPDYIRKGPPIHRKDKNIPNQAMNPIPADDEILQALTEFSWDPTYNDAADNIPIGFYFSLGTDYPPTNIVDKDVVISKAIYQLKDKFDYNTTYYWQVIPFNKYGETEECPVWSFTTCEEKDGLFAGGFGTEDDPWLIETAEQLDNIRDFIEGSYSYLQIADIDLGTPPWNEGKGWEPIDIFYGKYDGGGHSIRGLYINDKKEHPAGLFGFGYVSTVQNVYLEDVEIYAGGGVGGIMAVDENSCKITNCHVSGQITAAEDYAGGLISVGYNTVIQNCSNKALVKGSECVGGIVGEANGVKLYNSFNRGKVEGEIFVGGLIGIEVYYGVIRDSYSTGAVSGKYRVSPLTFFPIKEEGVSYWDIDKTGILEDFVGEGRTTEEMTYPYGENTYVGWDFDNVWVHDIDHSVNDGYPYLSRDMELSVEQDTVMKPLTLSLKNYPNPFNPETSISFNLPKASEVELAIYNIKGQLVERVINSSMEAGQHKVVWNGNDVSSGLYFYKLTTPEGSLINKMMLLK